MTMDPSLPPNGSDVGPGSKTKALPGEPLLAGASPGGVGDLVALARSPEEWEAQWTQLLMESQNLEAERQELLSRPGTLSVRQLAEVKAEQHAALLDTGSRADLLWANVRRVRRGVRTLDRLREFNSRRGGASSAPDLRALSGRLSKGTEAPANRLRRDLSEEQLRISQSLQVLADDCYRLEELVDAAAQRVEFMASAEPFLPADPEAQGALGASGESIGGAVGSSSPARSARSFSSDGGLGRSLLSARSRVVAPGLVPRIDTDHELCEIRSSLVLLEAQSDRGKVFRDWSPVEHDVFMRVARMFKSQATEAFFERLETCLPSRSREELVERSNWHAEERDRQAAKRRLLARWRERVQELERQATEAEGSACEVQRQRAESLRRRREDKQRLKLVEWQCNVAEEMGLALESQRQSEELKEQQARRQRRREQLRREEIRRTVEAFNEQRQKAEAWRKAREEELETCRKRAASRQNSRRVLLVPCDDQGEPETAPRSAGPTPPDRVKIRGASAPYLVESRLFRPTVSFVAKLRRIRPEEPNEEPEPMIFRVASAPCLPIGRDDPDKPAAPGP